MAKVQVVLDDVILAMKKGKRQIADRSTNLSIPAQSSSTGKRRFMKLDISDEGEKMLQDAIASRDKIMADAEAKYNEGVEKLKAERERAESNAWQDLNKIADKVDEMRPRRKRKGAEEEPETDSAADASPDSSVSPSDNSYGTPSDSQPSYSAPSPDTQQYGQPQQNQWS